MKKTIRLVVACLLFFVACSQSQQTRIQKQLDELLTGLAGQYKFNGAVLVGQKGKIIWQKGYGWKNKANNTVNDAQTIFQVGSLTKQFTTALILRLQQQNKLSVQDKLSKYFPGFPHAEKITIEHLMTHTAGIYNYTNDQAFMRTETGKPATQEKMLSLFKDKPLEFEPGSKFQYSNSGYMLLGYIIEKVTGKPYYRVMHEDIFKPLQMDHSGFDFTGLKSADKATGYTRLTGKEQVPASVVDSTVSYAAGAIYSTVGDLYKWDRALYTEKVINKTSLEQSFTPYKDEYGYGWRIGIEDGKKNVMHTGGIFGFTAVIVRRLDDETCVILLDNHGAGFREIMEQVKAIIDGEEK